MTSLCITEILGQSTLSFGYCRCMKGCFLQAMIQTKYGTSSPGKWYSPFMDSYLFHFMENTTDVTVTNFSGVLTL